ncbi:MAG: hypothetical protein A2X32_08445 [Elusimicrobia bacterium GWC2_64_44]|nr:MAG: hypothetical protein A2X32_08445 [Elusimicrobia bacterium GWC2_64_44]
MADILVIEDDGVVRDALRELLTRAGHCVRVASDGGSGVGVFRSQRPDLVILDRHLPVLSGSAVFANIRALAPEARIILLSGHDDPEAVAVYLNHGAAAFLSKGDGLSNVLLAVEAIVGTLAPKPAPACRVPARQALPLVLVADDDAMMRDILRRALDELGCRVLEAADGEEAARLALAHRPDIVILDMVMPRKGGLETLRELVPELPSAAFMVITGLGEEKSGREAMRLGAMDYITKPFNLALLKTAVEARLLQHDSLGSAGL